MIQLLPEYNAKYSEGTIFIHIFRPQRRVLQPLSSHHLTAFLTLLLCCCLSLFSIAVHDVLAPVGTMYHPPGSNLRTNTFAEWIPHSDVN
jgi:hypothetical protein